ncbi:MAG: hypothetical protein WD795_13160 [Woeseia sp.]
MARFDTLLKRLRNMGEVKSYERIQTVDGCETMTSTQACRFRELQNTCFEGKGNSRKVKSHYSLKEAARLLRSEVDDILLSAALGRLQCFVMSAGLRGHWRTTGHGEPRLPAEPDAIPKYLALSPADCRQIAAYGSVNVHDLEYPAGSVPDGGTVSTAAYFVLREPMWVDRKRIVLKHPLPK